MLSPHCILHPLALVSVCDSETRLRRGGSKLPPTAPLIGLLFGPTTSTTISICDGTVAIYHYDESSKECILNLPKIAERKTLWTTVYPTHELLGWFSVGVAIEEWHVRIHAEILGSLLFYGDPIFLLMNPSPDPNSRILPLSVLVLDQSQPHAGSQSSSFLPLKVSMDALQVEKIALDQIVKSAPNVGKSSLEIQNTFLIMSLNTLRAKVDYLIAAVSALKAKGQLDHATMRMIGKICVQLPEVVEESVSASLETELLDCLMLVQTSLGAKNTALLNDLSDKFLSTYGRRGSQF